MNKTTIEINDTKPVLSRLYGDNEGRVFLDTDANLGIRLTKALEELTDANEIQQEAALTTTIPQTQKNNLALEQYQANIINRTPEFLSVTVKSNGELLNIQKMKLIKFKDREQDIEVELIGNGWIQDLETTALNEIQGLADYENTISNLEDTWSDPTAETSMIPGDFGGWNESNQITRRDMRLGFNLAKLMRAALCQHGWNFKSPYYDGAVGSRLYGYLSPPRWYTYSSKKDQHAVDLNQAAPATISGGLQLYTFDDVEDPLNLYDGPVFPGEYAYPPNGLEGVEIIFKVKNMTIELQPYGIGNTPSAFFFACYRNEYGQPGPVIFQQQVNASATQVVTRTLNFEFSDEAAQPAYSYGFILGHITLNQSNTPSFDFELKSADIEIRPNPPYYLDDETIPVAELLDPSISAADLLKDMAALINAKILTDYVTKTVTLYPPFATEVYGNPIEGFFLRNQKIKDLTEYVEPQSREVINKSQDRERFVELKFADTKDAYIEQEQPGREPFSRTIDLGTGNAETATIELELFEPTIERTVETETGGNTGIVLPVMRDNNEGTISTDIGPRLLYNYGAVTQLNEDGDLRNYNLEGTTKNEIGYMAQVSTTPLQGNPLRVQIAFKEFENDLWRLFYRRYLNEKYSPLDFEFLVYLDLSRYKQINFRERVGIFYAETYLVYQITAIKDFDMEARTSTPVEMKLIDC